MSTPTRARFTWDDLLAFREASHDTNPLHTDPAYAARTHFGGPVVFGVLGGLAALAAVPQEPGQALQELDLEFRAAAFPDVDYALDVATRRRKTSATLRDAGRLLAKVSPRFAPGSVPRPPAEAAAAEDPAEARALYERARDLDTVPIRAPTVAIERIRALALAEGVVLVDAAADLPREEGLDVAASSLFMDPVHFTAAGHLALAELIGEHLRPLLPDSP